jgi:hypothetical protein
MDVGRQHAVCVALDPALPVRAALPDACRASPEIFEIVEQAAHRLRLSSRICEEIAQAPYRVVAFGSGQARHVRHPPVLAVIYGPSAVSVVLAIALNDIHWGRKHGTGN